MQTYSRQQAKAANAPAKRARAMDRAGTYGPLAEALNRRSAVQTQLRLDRTLNRRDAVTQKKNDTGMPDQLKSGIESLSGLSMDGVQVHYNSSTPAQLHALAYTQDTEIHLAAGQEQNLPHEAWHMVQQKQGRVRPTMQMRGVNINDDSKLESEADRMGKRAAGFASGKQKKEE